MSATSIAIGILALAGVGLIVVLYWSASRERRDVSDVPPSQRPGYSDDELETSVIERYMAWGVVLTLFFAIFFPVYWLLEPGRLTSAEQRFFVDDVVAGEELFQANCSECHGQQGQGGAAPVAGGEGTWPAPSLVTIAARYEENPNIGDIEEFLTTTIKQGRPGTPMPAWGLAFDGPLTDQQVDRIVTWILANQVPETDEATSAANLSGEELFQANCARCHGSELEGGVGPTLIGEFQRHSEATIMQILRNGIFVPSGAMMPPWQNGYMYPEARYSDEALQRIVDYVRSQQPADLLPEAEDEDGETEPEEPEPTEA